MPTIALKTETGSLLTFVLVAGSEPIGSGRSGRNCIITGPPKDPADLDHPLSIARAEHLHVEHVMNVESKEGLSHLSICVADCGELNLYMNRDDKGYWTFNGRLGSCKGTCLVAQKKKQE
jgi:hypothetical protein